MNHEFMEALDELVVDRGVDRDILIDTIEQAVLTAYKKNFGSAQNVRVEFDKENGIRVFSQRTVVDESDLYDAFLEIDIEDARKINPNYELGDIIENEVTPKDFGSRSHPGLVKRLFEEEVPEIYEGIVQIKSVAREAGSRTKMAVKSIDDKIDPIGACVGPKGLRVKNIVDELGDEKIDIIKYDEDPAAFISASLSPSKVVKVDVNEVEKSALVVVPDYQLSLAIGKEGQNARLAAKLTNWKIDIKSESQAETDMLAAANSKEDELSNDVDIDNLDESVDYEDQNNLEEVVEVEDTNTIEESDEL